MSYTLETNLTYTRVNITGADIKTFEIKTEKYDGAILELIYITSRKMSTFVNAKPPDETEGKELANKYRLVRRFL